MRISPIRHRNAYALAGAIAIVLLSDFSIASATTFDDTLGCGTMVVTFLQAQRVFR